MSTAMYAVEGIMCESCMAAVLEHVHSLSGVTVVAMDLVAGGPSPLIVTSGTKLGAYAVRDAIKLVGFDVLRSDDPEVGAGGNSPADAAGDFRPDREAYAEMSEGVQVIKVTVKGGYSPDVIQVASGVPVRMMFDRQESGDCSSRVVFPDFKVNQILPAFETTTVEFLPEQPGEYGFACGMGMLRGNILVGESTSVPDSSDGRDEHVSAPAVVAGGPDPLGAAAAAESADAEEREHNAEISDLKRRVIFGAVLTAPRR